MQRAREEQGSNQLVPEVRLPKSWKSYLRLLNYRYFTDVRVW